MSFIRFSEADDTESRGTIERIKENAPHLAPIIDLMPAWPEQDPQISTAVVTTYFNCSSLMERKSGLPSDGMSYIPMLRDIVRKALCAGSFIMHDWDFGILFGRYTDRQVDGVIRVDSERPGNIFHPRWELPVAFYARVITDSEPLESHDEVKRYLREMSQLGIFIGFEGVGGGEFSFLKKLTELDGRLIDNTGFFAWGDSPIECGANGKPISASVTGTQLDKFYDQLDKFMKQFVPNALRLGLVDTQLDMD